MIETIDIPDGDYNLTQLTIKEFIDKYPDKIVDVVNRKKDVVIIDDMVDTAGTLTKAADLMIKNGASSVRAYCTHGILSGAAYENLNNSKIKELVITNTIPKNHNSLKVREISVADFSTFEDNGVCGVL